MISTDCPNCGEAVSIFTKSCSLCGAYNASRRASIAVAMALGVLAVAIGIAIFAVIGWQPLLSDTESPATKEDYTWLRAAMKECDDEAAKAPTALYFLMIPLASAPVDDPEWRKVSLNDIGNAVLLSSDVALEGLKNGHLVISAEQYLLSVRDEATNNVFKWTPSTGVKRFSSADTKSIENFKVQITTTRRTNDTAWGAAFVRHQGNCYWVNAIIGN